MSWLIPAAVLICVAVRSPRRLIDALPLLISLPLLFAFFAFLYLAFSDGGPEKEERVPEIMCLETA